ncbi:MAG: phage portal protein [Candidatus Omnitrophica bacterium]|nr:phage portal protein [Candidatus Omnitrophota bacterium]
MREIKQPKKRFLESVSERLDTVIGVFSPAREYRRKAFRFVNKIALRGGYTGAKTTRLNENWFTGGGSADEDLLPDIQDLRERSRDLNRNDGIAAGVTGTMVTNVIGSGIQPQSYVDSKGLGLTPEVTEEFQNKVERIWERWEPHADAGNRMHFWEIQQLVQRQVLENGEVVIIPEMVEEPGRPYFLALNTVESDRLDTPSDKRADKNIRRGVEMGPRGQPIAYWICKTHPGDVTYRNRKPDSNEYIRYEAKNKYGRPNILHLYWVKRPGQTRGEPFFAPVVGKFKDLAEYMEAELVAARVTACFTVFIEQQTAFEGALAATTKTDSSGKRIETLEPGIIKRLNPGEKIEAFNPQRPGGAFDPFVDKVLRFIGAGLGLPYELVLKDFSKTNYSSARAAILEARKFFIFQQNWISDRLCQPTWDMLMDEAYLRGEFEAKDYFKRREDYLRVKWIAPGWSYIDPDKEISAADQSIRSNISTLADECAAHGKDWEEVLVQRAREEKKRKELGLPDQESNKLVLQGASKKETNTNGQEN